MTVKINMTKQQEQQQQNKYKNNINKIMQKTFKNITCYKYNRATLIKICHLTCFLN